jgi:hypothetical protein
MNVQLDLRKSRYEVRTQSFVLSICFHCDDSGSSAMSRCAEAEDEPAAAPPVWLIPTFLRPSRQQMNQ